MPPVQGAIHYAGQVKPSTCRLRHLQVFRHRFHRGVVSSAAVVGFNDYEIQQLGRWHSDSYKLYVDGSQSRILSLSSCLHWVVPHGQHFEPSVSSPPVFVGLSMTLWAHERADVNSINMVFFVHQHVRASIDGQTPQCTRSMAGGHVTICASGSKRQWNQRQPSNLQSHVTICV